MCRTSIPPCTATKIISGGYLRSAPAQVYWACIVVIGSIWVFSLKPQRTAKVRGISAHSPVTQMQGVFFCVIAWACVKYCGLISLFLYQIMTNCFHYSSPSGNIADTAIEKLTQSWYSYSTEALRGFYWASWSVISSVVVHQAIEYLSVEEGVPLYAKFTEFVLICCLSASDGFETWNCDSFKKCLFLSESATL